VAAARFPRSHIRTFVTKVHIMSAPAQVLRKVGAPRAARSHPAHCARSRRRTSYSVSDATSMGGWRRKCSACDSGVDGVFGASETLSGYVALQHRAQVLASPVAESSVNAGAADAELQRDWCYTAHDYSCRKSSASVSAAAGVLELRGTLSSSFALGVHARCWQTLCRREQRGCWCRSR